MSNPFGIKLWAGLAIGLVSSPLVTSYVLAKNIRSHLTLPAFLCSTILFGFLTKFFYLQEKAWVAKDELGAREGLHPTKLDAMIFESLLGEVESRHVQAVRVESKSAIEAKMSD